MSPVFSAPSSENLLLGKGQVFFDRFDAAGLPTGLRHLGNVETFEITTSDDNVDKYSSMTAGAPLYKRVNRRRTQTLRIVGDEFHPENMALAVMGDVSTLAQAATAVVGEPIAATTNPGTYYKTAKLGPISAVAVHFGAGAGVLNTDYAIVDANVGLIRILPGTILTGAVTIDYTPTAYSTAAGPKRVAGGVAGIVQGKVVFIGDPTTGPSTVVNVWRVNITPDGAVGLISDEYAQMTLSAAVLDDSPTHAEPFEVIYP
jgi:hypothetical protein